MIKTELLELIQQLCKLSSTRTSSSKDDVVHSDRREVFCVRHFKIMSLASRRVDVLEPLSAAEVSTTLK